MRHRRHYIVIAGLVCVCWGWFSGNDNRCSMRSTAIQIESSGQHTRTASERVGWRCRVASPPGPSIEPYVRRELAQRFQELRPAILAAASRHNRPALSGMSDREFAEVMALVLYNEQNGWLEDEIEALRLVTPLYQESQRLLNQSGIGSNFSVWPTNLRPSVALEILRGEVPLAGGDQALPITVSVAGSTIDLNAFASQRQLYAAINAELSDQRLAMEYLAANLARGVHRAHYEGVPITWRTLAAWHNQGIVDPVQIRANPTARDYVRRASAYSQKANSLIAGISTSE